MSTTLARARLSTEHVLAGLLICAGYYFGAKLGFALTLRPQPVSTLWPPNSILMAALLLTPPRLWWFIVLAAFPAHCAAQWQSNVPLSMMLCWFVSNTLEAMLGAGCVRYLAGGPFDFNSLRNVGVFIFGAVFLAPFLTSFLDSALVLANRWGSSGYWELWRTRFFSNVLAAMTVATVIVSWSKFRIDAIRKPPAARIGEAVSLIVGLLTVAFFVFIWLEPRPGLRPALVYAPLPFFLWAAVRFGFTGMSTAILAVTLLATFGTALGQGPFSARSPHVNALHLQLFLIVVSIPLLCLSALLQERRETEKALRSSEARYREVVETQTDLICRYLPDTTLTFVNQAYCGFFNRSREELIGTKFIDLLPQSSRGDALNHVASLASKPRVEGFEHEVRLPDGTAAWHQWIDHPILGPDGQIVEFQGIGRDITDRKRVEEANEKLTHLARLAMVGELTASIVHELSQPLGAILSNAETAEMLLEASSGDVKDIRQILTDIRKDDQRASEVIRHIRRLLHSRKVDMQAVEINEVVFDTLKFVSIEAHRRSIALITDLASGLPKVEGDEIQLQQVLLNLALNAMDAMAATPRKNRRLTVGTRFLPPDRVEVTMCDTGSGIPEHKLASLFEPFSTTKKDGMGLGLSISRAIIEVHQGRIWGENNAVKGATFGFSLPATEITHTEGEPAERS